jgi:hypothetical protein
MEGTFFPGNGVSPSAHSGRELFLINVRPQSLWQFAWMATLLFTCPITAMATNGWIADDPVPLPATFVAINCAACGRMHFVMPGTGEVLGSANRHLGRHDTAGR